MTPKKKVAKKKGGKPATKAKVVPFGQLIAVLGKSISLQMAVKTQLEACWRAGKLDLPPVRFPELGPQTFAINGGCWIGGCTILPEVVSLPSSKLD